MHGIDSCKTNSNYTSIWTNNAMEKYLVRGHDTRVDLGEVRGAKTHLARFLHDSV